MAGDLKPGAVAPGEDLRYQPLGVVGVIGPFNFPLHLCHAHVDPGAARRQHRRGQAERHHAAVRPALRRGGAGRGACRRACSTSSSAPARSARRWSPTPRLRGLCFTGSWAVGRRILEAALDRPELLVALEMGGKNACVVLDDCALRQAVHEVAVGGYLSAGQRCTGTERVLVHRKIADRFIEALAKVVRELQFGNPEDASVFAGPVATHGALDEGRGRARGRAQGRRRADRRRARSCPAATTARRRCTGCPTACITSPATPISRCSAPICASR